MFDYHNTKTYFTLKNYLPQISKFQKLQVSIDETLKNINLMVGLLPCFFDAQLRTLYWLGNSARSLVLSVYCLLV